MVPLLLILVVIHEFGHYATARAMGVKVLEFGVGFPPRAFGVYTGNTCVLIDGATRYVGFSDPGDLGRGQRIKVSSTEDANGNLIARVIELSKKLAHGEQEEEPDEERLGEEDLLNHEGKIRSVGGGSLVLADMLYSVNWAPIGGFVRLAGEANPNVPRSLAGKGTGTRFLVLVAGPLMNAILPLLIFTVILMIPRDVAVGRLVIQEVGEGTAAASAQVQAEDIVLQANGSDIENRLDFTREINLNGGSQMAMLVERDGQELLLHLRPRFDTESARWLVGVFPRLDDVTIVKQSEPIWEAIPNSFVNTWEMLVLVKQALGGAFGEGSSPEFSGPIGIAQVTGEITRDGGWIGWLGIGALLSINLAILNVLPIPMLDGGRIFFVVLEWARRGKKIPAHREGMVHLIGFALLMGGIVLVSVNDIGRLIDGRSFLG
ncbi:MAG: site-2 protease family protein [SAR202 cluster bacterium]|jgi:regulator of sigma E protease|nr:site-2 protease family protein [Dehalococcoidia bacterium]MQF89148.1 site-2 protease family protein [SAR202 cluster bacterium]|tara:strand:+ start:2720 stop:4018 length:1299 start_codon:yes stop_codon:yes gene_type:complete